MWEQRKSIKVKAVILVVLSIAFVPVSYMWYGMLYNLDCAQTMPGAGHVAVDAKNKGCEKTGTHWAVFYGLNAMIYAVPMLAILHLRKKSDLGP